MNLSNLFDVIIVGPGESILIAEEMAARNALRRLFHLTDRKAPLPFGKKGHEFEVKDEVPNVNISEWTTELASQRLAKCN